MVDGLGSGVSWVWWELFPSSFSSVQLPPAGIDTSCLSPSSFLIILSSGTHRLSLLSLTRDGFFFTLPLLLTSFILKTSPLHLDSILSELFLPVLKT